MESSRSRSVSVGWMISMLPIVRLTIQIDSFFLHCSVQLNTDEPVQHISNLDMYTSRNYGEDSITLTLVIPLSRLSPKPPVLDIRVVVTTTTADRSSCW